MATSLGGEAGESKEEIKEEKLKNESPIGMEDILDEAHSLRVFRRGDIVEGVIMRVSRDGLLIDIGSKTEGIVYPHEMQSLDDEAIDQMKVGDEAVAHVLRPENEDGQVVLSIDRARGEKEWRNLQKCFENGEILEADVIGFNKGGLLVSIDGISGFIPVSQAAGLRLGTKREGASGEDNRFDEWVGRRLKLKIIEINRRRNRLILSEKAALQHLRLQKKEKLISELKEGEIRKGKVTSIRNFGAFVDLGGADGLVHLSELSWNRIEGPEQVLTVGDEIEVYVLKIDTESKRIALSLRRTQPEPWLEILGKYQIGQYVNGTVTKLVNFGAFARIEDSIEGLIHISELTDRRIMHPREIVREGDVLRLRIIKFDPERHRLGLSLKQALEVMETETEDKPEAEVEEDGQEEIQLVESNSPRDMEMQESMN